MISKSIAGLIAVTILCGFSFSEKWGRYPRPDEIILLFQDRFPLGKGTSEDNNCQDLTINNRAFLGDSRPADGKPLVSEPNLHFVKWYTLCLAKAVAKEVAHLRAAQDSATMGTIAPQMIDWIALPQDPLLKAELLLQLADTKPIPSTPASPASPALKNYLVSQLVLRLIGPDNVIDDKPPLLSAKDLKARILRTAENIDYSPRGFQTMGFETLLLGSESTIYGYVSAVMLLIGLQDEFLVQ